MQSSSRDDVQVDLGGKLPQPRALQADSEPQIGPSDRDSESRGGRSTFMAPRDSTGKYTSHGDDQVIVNTNPSNFVFELFSVDQHGHYLCV